MILHKTQTNMALDGWEKGSVGIPLPELLIACNILQPSKSMEPEVGRVGMYQRYKVEPPAHNINRIQSMTIPSSTGRPNFVRTAH